MPAARAFWGDAGDELLDLLADHHHHVREFVDHHQNERQRRQGRRLIAAVALQQRVRNWLPALLGVSHMAVVAGQIAHAQGRHQLVASLHFADAPVQRMAGLGDVGDHRRQQMGNALVNGKLQHFRVHENQAHVFRARLVEDAHQHGVDPD